MRTQEEINIKNKHAYILSWAKKLKAVEMLGGVCCKCGCSDLRVIEFHHLDPTVKESAVATLRILSWPEIEKEIIKCVLLCKRCHFIEHCSTNSIEEDSRYKISKNILLTFIGKKECEKCGWSGNQAALQFHHEDPNKKEFLLSDIRIQSLAGLQQHIIDEINKCCLLCANCHQLEHIDERYVLYQKEIIERSKSINTDFFRVDSLEIRRLYLEEGWSAYKIAKFYNKSKSTILHHIHKMGISR